MYPALQVWYFTSHRGTTHSLYLVSYYYGVSIFNTIWNVIPWQLVSGTRYVLYKHDLVYSGVYYNRVKYTNNSNTPEYQVWYSSHTHILSIIWKSTFPHHECECQRLKIKNNNTIESIKAHIYELAYTWYCRILYEYQYEQACTSGGLDGRQHRRVTEVRQVRQWVAICESTFQFGSIFNEFSTISLQQHAVDLVSWVPSNATINITVILLIAFVLEFESHYKDYCQYYCCGEMMNLFANICERRITLSVSAPSVGIPGAIGHY